MMEALGSIFSSSSQQQLGGSKGTRGKVLVAGATGGVGKRVVEELRKNGVPVVALVRPGRHSCALVYTLARGRSLLLHRLLQNR
jgi:nucleoside-diphosphate-sugar epimerase